MVIFKKLNPYIFSNWGKMLSKQFIPHWQFNWFFKIKLLILQEPNKPLKLHTHVFLSKFISPPGLYLWCTVRLCMWLRYKALCATVFCFGFFLYKKKKQQVLLYTVHLMNSTVWLWKLALKVAYSKRSAHYDAVERK